MRFFLLLSLVAALTWAKECRWRVKDFDIGWTAFKTPLKLPVEGKFDAVRLSAKPKAKIDELLEGASVLIDTESVDTANGTRNARIVKHFFKIQGVDTITARIISVDKDLANVEITMNDTTRTVPMRLQREENRITAAGVIDLGDFKLLPSLQSLTDACRKPHEGKTWQDVTLTFTLEVMQKCR
ncbi:MAG: YceI family protein [Epsilonproteobacteria bacterium]|nr:YceI family protein [Campylobacterota bacterium]